MVLSIFPTDEYKKEILSRTYDKISGGHLLRDLTSAFSLSDFKGVNSEKYTHLCAKNVEIYSAAELHIHI